MCTVTFIPAGHGCILTSSRDERPGRANALSPAWFEVDGTQLLYPRDAEGGGTWIAVKEGANAAVLLNGAFKRHLSQPPYKKSRGLVLTSMLAATDAAAYFIRTDFTGIEPFTVILVQEKQLFECRWDGTRRYFISLDASVLHIWSSATLYDEPARIKRENWFRQWSRQHTKPLVSDVIKFHYTGGDGDQHNDICMHRPGLHDTVSITAIALTGSTATMHYHDLKAGSNYTVSTNTESLAT